MHRNSVFVCPPSPSSSLCLPAFSASRFLAAVDQTERIRACIGSRNNDEYINHAKSESMCHVYGHRGDGIYPSLSRSSHIIRYATSQSFEKKRMSRRCVSRCVSLSFTLCLREHFSFIIDVWAAASCLSGGGHRRGEGGRDFPLWPHPALLQPPWWDLLRHHHQPGRGV